MKNLIATIAIALVGFSAQASMIESYDASLETFNFQPGSFLSNETQNQDLSGEVRVTPKFDITLSIYHSIKCDTRHFCPAIAYAPAVYQVKFQSMTVGACHERIFTGLSDFRLADGTLTEIVVVDNSTNVCETLVALPVTSISLTIQGGGRANLNEVHHMTAGPLRELM